MNKINTNASKSLVKQAQLTTMSKEKDKMNMMVFRVQGNE